MIDQHLMKGFYKETMGGYPSAVSHAADLFGTGGWNPPPQETSLGQVTHVYIISLFGGVNFGTVTRRQSCKGNGRGESAVEP